MCNKNWDFNVLLVSKLGVKVVSGIVGGMVV